MKKDKNLINLKIIFYYYLIFGFLSLLGFIGDDGVGDFIVGLCINLIISFIPAGFGLIFIKKIEKQNDDSK